MGPTLYRESPVKTFGNRPEDGRSSTKFKRREEGSLGGLIK